MNPVVQWSRVARCSILILTMLSVSPFTWAAADTQSAAVGRAPATDLDGTPSAVGESEEFDIRIPRYQQIRPSWGVQVGIAPAAFNSSRPITSPLAGSSLRAVSIQVEYELPAQKYGIFSIGPDLSLYRPATTGITKSLIGIWSGGGQIRYQARFFREQVLVPSLSYQMEYLSYNASGQTGKFIAKGPVFGLWLLLNSIDRDSATAFYNEDGVIRSYFVAELREVSGNDAHLSLGGSSAFFGLRFEL